MSDLVAFLTARLDEDEQIARAADGGPKWFVGRKWNVYAEPSVGYASDLDDVAVDDGDLVVYGNALPYSEHIARHGPARVLREVEVKRRILARYQETAPSPTPWGSTGWADARTQEIHETLGDEVVPLLALSYADHPDYPEGWKP